MFHPSPQKHNKKSSYLKSFFLTFNLKQTTYYYNLFAILVVSLVLAHELINTSCGVNEFQFTCEVRMRSVGDFQFHNVIFITVGIDNFLFGVGTALGENHSVIRHVFEYYESVVRGMDSFFHFL